LVTVADIEAERRLAPMLTAYLPGSIAVGEEAASADPGLIDRVGGDAPVWLIDPVDGTLNFSEGNERFCVMVALVRGGRAVAAWIHDPIYNLTTVAEIGGGAWIGSERLRVAPAVPPERMTGLLTIRLFDPETRERLRERRKRLAKTLTLRCAGHEYLHLASGQVHLGLYYRLLPWDHAPGTLIHAEAGGYAAMLDGRPYAPTVHAGGLLVVPDRESWAEAKALLFG
jgi:fructose-1,6-bisphosphatase/inositol monophosphatase family enzyme